MQFSKSLTVLRTINIKPLHASFIYMALAVVYPAVWFSVIFESSKSLSSAEVQELIQRSTFLIQGAHTLLDGLKENSRLIDNAVATGDKDSLDRALQTVRENQKAQQQASQQVLEKVKQQQDSETARRTPSVKQFVSPAFMTALLLFLAYQSAAKYRRSIN
jgi:hypothetical protein